MRTFSIRTLLRSALLFPAAVFAQETYYIDKTANLPVSGISSGAAGPCMDVEFADLNGDGFSDVILAHEFIANVILFNDGKGKFTNVTAGRLPQSEQDSEDIAIADFDGDGDPDIVFVSEDIIHGQREHEYYLNDGSGTFTVAPYRLPSSEANAVGAADLNNDGYPDLLIGNNGQNTLLINDGTGSFTDETSTRLPVIEDITQDVKIADLDGDGDLDIMTGNEDRNRLLINDGTGIFTDESMDRLPQDVNIETRKVTIMDVNGDEAPDIFLANVAWQQGKVIRNRLYINNGSGVFSDETQQRLPEDNEFTLDGIFTDVDLDGDPDLVTVNIQNFPYRTYFNDGTGVFTEVTGEVFPTLLIGSGLAVKAGDLDGDGIDDLYFGNRDRKDYLLLHTDASTGVLDYPAYDNDLRLFPNPCREFLTVGWPGNGSSTPSVSISTLTGATPGGESAIQWHGTSCVVPTEALPPGVYMITVQAGTDRYTRSFIRE